MRKVFIIACSLLTAGTISGQENCSCDVALSNLITKVESEYPGFAEKTRDSLLYNSVRKELVAKSKKLDSGQCLDVLRRFTSFFKDGHIWILPNEQDKPLAEGKNEVPKQLDINISEFKKRIRKSKDKLEGIWKDANYTLGVTKTGENQYTGFIIATKNQNWKPKEIKLQLSGNQDIIYYLSDHSSFKDTFEVHEDYLLYIHNLKSTFIKQNLDRKLDSLEVAERVNELDGFYFKKLSEKSSLIRISSFNYPYVERIKKLIEDNKAGIGNSENLIIDIRNNGGGTDDAYKELLPLIATNPMRNVGIELLSTQGLIDGVTAYRNGLIEKDPETNRAEIIELEDRINIYKDNFGHFVNPDSKSVRIDSVPIANRSPKQIIILANDKVASASENFLLKARQSKKVKILGTPTSGVLDYANAYFFKFGCDNYRLLLPTYRSLRIPDYPIDNIGIQPDIYLDKTIHDWVKYAMDYVED